MADAGDDPDGSGSLRRACDQCRARKIRCDKESPCANCRTGQRRCSWTSALQKPHANRQRVLISHQYERKIDQFESRLVGIETLLRDLTTALTRDGASGPDATGSTGLAHPPSPIIDSRPARSGTPPADDKPAFEFEGDSSMAAHTAFASEFLQQAVTRTAGPRPLGVDIRGALASLQQLVQMRESRFAHQKPVPRGGLARMPLPPTEVVVELLREVKASPPMAFMMSCAFLTVEGFIESCRRVYFATEDYTTATFIVVNAGLYYLFEEKATVDDARREEHLRYHRLCRDNLETALASLPLFLVPQEEMIEALLLGVTYAIEISKFTLAWQLNSAAANMCLTLGLHRSAPPSSSSSSSSTRASTFWFCYMLDKGFALRLGRPAVIQDWDVSAPRSFGNNTALPAPWAAVLDMWIESGSVLGLTYERLYSPAALARPAAERVETAGALVGRLEALWVRVEEATAALKHTHQQQHKREESTASGNGSAMTLDMILYSGQVSHWASLTLIYRALPSAPGRPGTFNGECIDAARRAMASHEECMALTAGHLAAQTGYLNWTILYTPFTPFIVLFCHVIETSNPLDLARLATFTATLAPAVATAGASPAIERLRRLCGVLHHVAALYVEAKAAAAARRDQDEASAMAGVGGDFDACLAQLGLVNPQVLGQGGEGGGDGCGVEQMVQLGEWFEGNRHVMGLMEEELFDFDPGMWAEG